MSSRRLEVAKLKDFVEIVGKIILGILALCYALGLLVVNLYYSRYGVYSLSLFRLNYVIAGVWVVTPIIIMFFAILSIFAIGYYFKPTRKLINRLADFPLVGELQPTLLEVREKKLWSSEDIRRSGFMLITMFALGGILFIWFKLNIRLTGPQWANIITSALSVNVVTLLLFYFSVRSLSVMRPLAIYGLFVLLFFWACIHLVLP